MSAFKQIHTALHNSNLGKAVNEVKHHPVASYQAAKFAVALA